MSNPLVGTWKLVSFEFRASDGTVSYPFGPGALGYIIYSEDGYMSAALMADARPNFPTDDLRGASTEDKAAAFDSHLSYSGRHEVHEGRVVHHPDVGTFPNWVGRAQERFIEIEGDVLSISTPPMVVDGVEGRSYLVWARP